MNLCQIGGWKNQRLTGLRAGHEVLFAGKKISEIDDRNLFAKIYEMNWTAGARYGIPTYWRSVKKQFEKIIRDVRPDKYMPITFFPPR